MYFFSKEDIIKIRKQGTVPYILNVCTASSQKRKNMENGTDETAHMPFSFQAKKKMGVARCDATLGEDEEFYLFQHSLCELLTPRSNFFHICSTYIKMRIIPPVNSKVSTGFFATVAMCDFYLHYHKT